MRMKKMSKKKKAGIIVACFFGALTLGIYVCGPGPSSNTEEPTPMPTIEIPFDWEFINVEIDVQENGDMLITETQKCVLTSPNTNRRYRYIPRPRGSLDNIDNIEVYEGNQLLTSDTEFEDNLIKIGWEHDLNPPESHTFVLKYRVIGGVHIDEKEGDQIRWRALHAERHTIEDGQVKVRLPESLAGEIIHFQSYGALDSEEMMNPRTVVFQLVKPLPPREEMDVHVTFTHGILNRTPFTTSSLPEDIELISIPLSMFAILFIIKKRRPYYTHLKWWRVIVPPIVMGVCIGININWYYTHNQSAWPFMVLGTIVCINLLGWGKIPGGSSY